MAELILMIPGPTWVRPEVLAQCAREPWGHRDKAETPLRLGPIKRHLKQLLYCEEGEYEILVSTSSGAGLMEAAIVNCVQPDQKVLNVSVGAFGDLWNRIVKSVGRTNACLTFAPGEHAAPNAIRDALAKDEYAAVCVTMNETSTGVTNPIAEIGEVVQEAGALYLVDAVSCLGGVPIQVQKWGIDVVAASTQKALGLPPGLSVAAVSARAFAAAEQNPYRGSYFDFLSFRSSNAKDQTPNTPATNLIDGLAYQMDYIVNTEGIENRFRRHTALADAARAWIETMDDGFSLLPAPAYASNTVTCVQHPASLDKPATKAALRERGYLFDSGYSKLEDAGLHTFRIPTMGDLTEEMLQTYLGHLSELMGG